MLTGFPTNNKIRGSVSEGGVALILSYFYTHLGVDNSNAPEFPTSGCAFALHMDMWTERDGMAFLEGFSVLPSFA